MRKIKILYIQLLPLLSGVQNMMLRLIDSLDKNKYDISVACKNGGPLIDELKKRNVSYYEVKNFVHPISIKNDILAFFEIYSIIKQNKFDIVHTHSSKPGLLGRIAAKLAGTTKIIHTVHGFAFHSFQSPVKQKMFMFLEKFAGLFCDKAVFVNNQDRIFAIKSKILPQKKVLTIYNGIKLNEIDKIQKTGFVVGSVLRFDEQKNIVNTVKAAINVCKTTPEISFKFIGDGKFYRLCQKLVAKNKLQKQILLPGWQNNINYELANFDVFLLFSKWEGLPLSILEAMASGLPIIASNIKGNNELVINNYNGFLINVSNLKKLENTILHCYNQQNMLNQLGKNSKKLVNEKFSFQNFALGYKRLYE